MTNLKNQEKVNSGYYNGSGQAVTRFELMFCANRCGSTLFI